MRLLNEVRPNLWLYEAQASGISVRGALIRGQRHAAVWDSLAHPDDVRPLLPLLEDTPFHLIYSHADWDHCWGSAGFMRPPLSIIAQAHCRRRFHDDVPATLRRMSLDQPEHWDAVRLIPPNIHFKSALTLDLGGINLELRHLPGHTPDCIVGWIPQWGVLLGGDGIETPLPVVNRGDQVDSWLAHLRRWSARPDVSLAIPAHGEAAGRSALEQTIAYLSALSGSQKFDLPSPLATFYAETHEKNLLAVAGGSGSSA